MTATSQQTQRMELTVGQVAESFGVTVRTLHHYDTVGLVVPGARTHAGYRLYDDDDLARLATVVTYRRLGLPLEEVRALVEGDGTPVEHLQRQRAAVLNRVDELKELLGAIDRALEREMDEQAPATTEDLLDFFGDGFSEDYRAEAEERWGETDAWKQSAARTKRYATTDWEAIKAEQDEVNSAFTAALAARVSATSGQAMDAAEAHRVQIHRWFYDLDNDFHRDLADLFVADPRFTKTYEDLAPGLAAYVRDAIYANADRHDAH